MDSLNRDTVQYSFSSVSLKHGSVRFHTLTSSYLKNDCFSCVVETLYACVRRHIIGGDIQSPLSPDLITFSFRAASSFTNANLSNKTYSLDVAS